MQALVQRRAGAARAPQPAASSHRLRRFLPAMVRGPLSTVLACLQPLRMRLRE